MPSGLQWWTASSTSVSAIRSITQELFEQEELTGYLKQSMESSKSVYERVIYQSQDIEGGFAEQLENSDAVKLYTKLPAWFKVPTPLGTYNSDWAVLIEKDGAERLYLVSHLKGLSNRVGAYCLVVIPTK